ELWRLYNGRLGPGETLRIFPLSDWTEADIWTYVAAQKIEVASLYFAAERTTIVQDGTLLIADDGREGVVRRVRVRTVGCWPLTRAVESDAGSIEAILAPIVREGTAETVAGPIHPHLDAP